MRKDIIDMLMELETEQIKEVQRKYKEKYPDDRQFSAKCQIAISMKKAQKRTNDFISLIENVKSAPSSATNTEQGNETR